MQFDAVDPEEANAVLQLCKRCQEEITSLTHVRYTTTWELVNQAGLCHLAMSYVAAAVMCRAALEATLHEVFAWKKKDDKLYLEPMLKYCTPNLEHLIEWAKDMSLITNDQTRIAHEIRRKGNFGAHLKQKIDLELSKYLSKGKAPDKPYQLWIDKQESRELLNETVGLVTALVKRALEIEGGKH